MNLELKFGENIFETKEKFEEAIRLGCNDSALVDDILSHEFAHYDKAQELGYHPRFSMYIDRDFTAKDICVKTIEQSIPPTHKIAIALAPANPSPADYLVADEARCSR